MVMPAVKANAYGHGAVLIGRALQDMGVQDFCVASVGEAIELREAGITGRILVLGYTFPEQFQELWKYSLTQTVIDFCYARQLQITGVFSHLCVSDGISESEKGFTYKHYVRPGIALYGALSSPYDKTAAAVNLKPVLSLKARIECVKQLHTGEAVGYGQTYTAAREMKIAAVSIGYADGIPRELSNKGFALIKGHKAPVVGRICMDQLMVDLSEIPGTAPGDEAVFIGKCGNEQITASEFAHTAGTISNEILSRLGAGWIE